MARETRRRTDLPGVLLAADAMAVQLGNSEAAFDRRLLFLSVWGWVEAELFNNGGAAAGMIELECRVERIDGSGGFLDRMDGSDS